MFLLPGADVRRGDELRGTDQLGQHQRLRVLSVVAPSTPVYRRAACELVQREGA